MDSGNTLHTLNTNVSELFCLFYYQNIFIAQNYNRLVTTHQLNERVEKP